MKAVLVSLLVFVLAASKAGAADTSHFDAGNRAFEEKKYLEAREHYQALIEQGIKTANLYFNVGSVNQQIGADGLAMLNYERALALEPRHREAFAALDLLRKSSTAKLPERTWRERTLGLLTFDQWLIAACAAGWLAIFSLLLPFARRRAIGFAAGGLATVSILAAAVAGSAAWLRRSEMAAAIVVAKQAEARLAPADRAALADTLPAGSRVVWLNERSGWVECRLPSGGRAWVPASAVERVRPQSS
jgi:hypothetical protein